MLSQVILDEHCDFLIRILKLVLNPKLRHLETEFTIDMRNFKNFQLRDQNFKEEEEEQLEEQGIKVKETLSKSSSETPSSLSS